MTPKGEGCTKEMNRDVEDDFIGVRRGDKHHIQGGCHVAETRAEVRGPAQVDQEAKEDRMRKGMETKPQSAWWVGGGLSVCAKSGGGSSVTNKKKKKKTGFGASVQLQIKRGLQTGVCFNHTNNTNNTTPRKKKKKKETNTSKLV